MAMGYCRPVKTQHGAQLEQKTGTLLTTERKTNSHACARSTLPSPRSLFRFLSALFSCMLATRQKTSCQHAQTLAPMATRWHDSTLPVTTDETVPNKEIKYKNLRAIIQMGAVASALACNSGCGTDICVKELNSFCSPVQFHQQCCHRVKQCYYCECLNNVCFAVQCTSGQKQ